MPAKTQKFKPGQYVAWEDINECTRVAKVVMPPFAPFNIMVVCNCWNNHSFTAIDSGSFDRLRILDNDPMPPKEPLS